jgi:hypothetical protein
MWSFGIFSQLWYVAQRKIWQPWLKQDLFFRPQNEWILPWRNACLLLVTAFSTPQRDGKKVFG